MKMVKFKSISQHLIDYKSTIEFDWTKSNQIREFSKILEYDTGQVDSGRGLQRY